MALELPLAIFGVNLNPSKLPKLTLESSEEMKKFGKIRRPPREAPSQISSALVGVVFLPFIHLRFKITKAMRYCLEEAHSIAYIFGDSMNPKETLFKRGDMKLDREDFNCLLPGQELSAYIMQLMALKTAWTQSQLQQHTEFVLNPNITDGDIDAFFSRDYLPTPNALKYVYVQMKDRLKVDQENHFYLMVVDIQGWKIWLLDSYPTDDTIIGRKCVAKAVARTLDNLMKVKFIEVNLLGRRPPLAEWNPEFVLGVLNMGN
ncbi:uncharacterized protein [Arachis hypogaea]|uniref:uncharacterized protein n=2 Tax=Arachis TaxID=3817 RepID=UPI000DEC3276